MLAAFLAVAPVAAQTAIKVARAELSLPAGEWVVLPAATVNGLTVIDRLRIEAESQTAFVVQSGALRAWVEVAATPRTFGYPLELANICRTRSATLWSQAVEEDNPLDLQCVSASAAFGAARMLQARPVLTAAASQRGLTLPKELVLVSAYILRQKGLLMSVNLYAEPSFIGDDKDLLKDVLKDVPARVNAQHSAYALQLLARVRECLYAMRCAVGLPAVLFAESVPAKLAP
jgi:hypothetical protein